MPTLKTKDYIKMNEKMSENFKLDANYYVTWGEKTAIKYIKVKETETGEEYISAKLEFRKTSEAWKDPKEYALVLFMEYWVAPKESHCMSSSKRKQVVIKTGYARKTFLDIQKETANWSNEKVLEAYNAAADYKFYGEI